MDSPIGSRRGTLRENSSSARQRRAHLQEIQERLAHPFRGDNATEEEPASRCGSAPIPGRRRPSRHRENRPAQRRYIPIGFAPQANTSLTRNLSMTSVLRYSNRDRFDQNDLSRVMTAAQSPMQSPRNVHSPVTLHSPADQESNVSTESGALRHISFKNVIYEVRPGDCPHCSARSYTPLRFASQPRMPGSWDESHHPDSDIIIEDLSQLMTTPSTQLIQHHQLCPRYRSKGRVDWHWEDQRPMWLPQLTEHFTLSKAANGEYPRDLWRDYEVSRAWAQGRKAVVRRHLGEPHHDIADIPAAVPNGGAENEKLKARVRRFSVDDIDK